jgi:uncharacterized protein YpiB (UPF0302 family)
VNKQRKPSDVAQYEREEKLHHSYKIQKNLQQKKMLRQLDRALQTKDYAKLVQMDDY